MIEWRDNSNHSVEADIAEALRPLANRSLSALLKDHGKSLLIFPQSLQQSPDLQKGEQYICDLVPCTDGWKVHTGNLAGFIGLNDLKITIRSRFGAADGADYFLHYMLQKVLSVNLFNLQHTAAEDTTLNFMLLLFPYYLNKALAQGLYKEYQRRDYNDSRVRGPIDLSRQLQRNIPFAGRIAYHTREFIYDNHVTELIRHTVEYIRTQRLGSLILHIYAQTQANVAQITAATPCWNRHDRLQVMQRNLKLLRHPWYTQYAPLQQLCLKILRHEQLKYGQSSHEIYGVLFDVSWLWEEYLNTLLKPLGFKHPQNRTKSGRIYLGIKTDGEKVLPRYPDFYAEDLSMIIDAKYKQKLDEISDVNQIITYMYRLKGLTGMFVLPGTGVHTEYRLHGYGDDDDALLIKHYLPIPAAAASFEDFTRQIQPAEQAFISQVDRRTAKLQQAG